VFTVSYLRSRGAPLISCNIWETHTVLFNLDLFLAKARSSLATAPTRLYDLHSQLSFCMPCNRFRLSRESLVLMDRGPTASFQYMPVTFLGSYCPDGSTKSGRTRRREINHFQPRSSPNAHFSRRTSHPQSRPCAQYNISYGQQSTLIFSFFFLIVSLFFFLVPFLRPAVQQLFTIAHLCENTGSMRFSDLWRVKNRSLISRFVACPLAFAHVLSQNGRLLAGAKPASVQYSTLHKNLSTHALCPQIEWKASCART